MAVGLLAARMGLAQSEAPTRHGRLDLDLEGYSGTYHYTQCGRYAVRYGGLGATATYHFPSGATLGGAAAVGTRRTDRDLGSGMYEAGGDSLGAGLVLQAGYAWRYFGFRLGGALYSPMSASGSWAPLPAATLLLGNAADGLSIELGFADRPALELGVIRGAVRWTFPDSASIAVGLLATPLSNQPSFYAEAYAIGMHRLRLGFALGICDNGAGGADVQARTILGYTLDGP